MGDRPSSEAPAQSAPAPSGGWKPSLIRLAGGAAIVAGLVVALWQAGVLFQGGGGAVAVQSDGASQTVKVQNANASLDTPNSGALTVGTHEGNLAPDFEVTDLSGNRVRLSDFRGRPVLLNFWATWCGPCKEEMPDIQKVLDAHQDDHLAVLAVDYGETYQRARQYVGGLGLRFTEVGLDPGLDVARRYNLDGLPTSFFINSDGVITHVFQGQTSRGSIDFAVRDTIQGVLGQ